ncbi:hypothetical protein JW710_00550 [Candidatus Dojkabacteria bacterium]|nr:hypothetical protein [Candidatus Dojkabacteria bacterium]
MVSNSNSPSLSVQDSSESGLGSRAALAALFVFLLLLLGFGGYSVLNLWGDLKDAQDKLGAQDDKISQLNEDLKDVEKGTVLGETDEETQDKNGEKEDTADAEKTGDNVTNNFYDFGSYPTYTTNEYSYNFNPATDLIPSASYTYDIGTPSLMWDEVYAGDYYGNNFYGGDFYGGFYGDLTGNVTGCVTTLGGSSYCNDADIVGTLNVDGAVTMGSTLGVAGDATFNSDIYVGNNSYIANNSVVGNSQLVMNNSFVGNSLLVNNNALIGNSAIVANNLGVGNNLGVAGMFGVLGDAYFGSDGYIDGDFEPLADNAYDLGSATERWANIYGVSLNVSDLVADTVSVNDLTVDGESWHNGPEHYYDVIDAQAGIYNDAGTLLFDDDVDVTGDVYIAGGVQIMDYLDTYGNVDLAGDSFDYVHVWGASTFYADSMFNQDVYLGDSSVDTIYVNGRLGTDLIPDTNATYDVGSWTLRWNNGNFANAVRVGTGGSQTVLANGRVQAQNNSLLVQATGTSNDVTVDSADDITLRANGGTITAAGDLIPGFGASYDLGKSWRPWARAYADNFYGVFNGDINGCLYTTGGSVYCDDSSVAGDLDVTGNSLLSGTFDVLGPANMGGTLDVLGSTSLANNTLTVQSGSAESLAVDPVGKTYTVPSQYEADLTGDMRVSGSVVIEEDAAVQGDMVVAGVIDPQAIVLTPGDDDLAVEVRNVGGWNSFTVDEDGNVTASGNMDLGGELEVDGNMTVNAQLSVVDLSVSGTADINDASITVVSSNLVPDIGTEALGSVGSYWSALYANNGYFSGGVGVSGTLTVGTLMIGATDVQNALTTLDGRVTSLEDEFLAGGRVNDLEGRVDLLEDRKVVIGGYTASGGTISAGYPNNYVTVVINVGSAMDSITVTPVGADNLRVSLVSSPVGSSSVTVRVYGPNPSTVVGVSWVAVLQ